MIKRGAFYPQPNVDSAVVTLEPRGAGPETDDVSQRGARGLRTAPKEAQKRVGRAVRRSAASTSWRRPSAPASTCRRAARRWRVADFERMAAELASMKRRFVALALLRLACDRERAGRREGGGVRRLLRRPGAGAERARPRSSTPRASGTAFASRFAAPLARDVPVAWEVSLPATDKGGPRAAHGRSSHRQGRPKRARRAARVPSHGSARLVARQGDRGRRRRHRSRLHGRRSAETGSGHSAQRLELPQSDSVLAARPRLQPPECALRPVP